MTRKSISAVNRAPEPELAIVRIRLIRTDAGFWLRETLMKNRNWLKYFQIQALPSLCLQ
jgi:hypothetical protein